MILFLPMSLYLSLSVNEKKSSTSEQIAIKLTGSKLDLHGTSFELRHPDEREPSHCRSCNVRGKLNQCVT